MADNNYYRSLESPSSDDGSLAKRFGLAEINAYGDAPALVDDEENFTSEERKRKASNTANHSSSDKKKAATLPGTDAFVVSNQQNQHLYLLHTGSTLSNKTQVQNRVRGDGTSTLPRSRDSPLLPSFKRSSRSANVGGRRIHRGGRSFSRNRRVKIVNLNEYRTAKHCAAVWTHLSRLLSDSSHAQIQKREQHKLANELEVLFNCTMKRLNECRSIIQLSQTAVNMAKIIKTVCDCGQRQITNQSFHNALIGHNRNKMNRLFQVIASTAVRLLPRPDYQGYANLAYACATAGVVPTCEGKTLFEHITDAVIAIEDQRKSDSSQVLGGAIMNKNHEFTSEALSKMLWAYATVGHVDTPLFAAMAPTVRALLVLNEYSNQSLASIAWSYAVANVDAPALFNELFIDVVLEKIDEFKVAQLRQLYQWHLWQKEKKSSNGLPFAFEGKCYKAFISTEPRGSCFQMDVMSVLRSIGLSPKEEYLTSKGYSLDALVEVNGNKIGIEVDGPTHFIGKEPTGNTTLKQRQVKTLEGISLVSVPYWRWTEQGQDSRVKKDYLRHELGMNKAKKMLDNKKRVHRKCETAEELCLI